MRARLLTLALATLLASCGQSSSPPAPAAAPPLESPADEASPGVPPVDSVLLATPNEDFAAIEPSEIGVQGASTLDEALAALTADTHSESSTLQVSVREDAETATADIVRMGLGDDSVAGAHIRVEFRREPEGWFPTNAYRRFQCARGALAGQWSVNPCP